MDCFDFLHYDYNLYDNVDNHDEDRDVQYDSGLQHVYGAHHSNRVDVDVLLHDSECDNHRHSNDLQHDGDGDRDCY